MTDEPRDFTFASLLEPGELGDTKLDVRLSARELGALQFLITCSMANGVFETAVAGAETLGLGHRWGLAMQSAQTRMGIAIARVLAPERAAEFAVELARIDQEQMSLDDDGSN